MEEKKNNYIGGLWINTTNKGKKFMSGNIEINGEKIAIVVWNNDNKKDNQPDYRIKLNDYKKEEPQEKKYETIGESKDILPF